MQPTRRTTDQGLCVGTTNGPVSRLCFLNGDDTEEMGLKFQTHFSTFKQPKHRSVFWFFGTYKTVVMRCLIGFEFSAPLALHCWQNKGLSQSKNKYREIAVLFSLLATYASGRRTGLMYSLADGDQGLYAIHSYKPRISSKGHWIFRDLSSATVVSGRAKRSQQNYCSLFTTLFI